MGSPEALPEPGPAPRHARQRPRAAAAPATTPEDTWFQALAARSPRDRVWIAPPIDFQSTGARSDRSRKARIAREVSDGMKQRAAQHHNVLPRQTNVMEFCQDNRPYSSTD